MGTTLFMLFCCLLPRIDWRAVRLVVVSDIQAYASAIHKNLKIWHGFPAPGSLPVAALALTAHSSVLKTCQPFLSRTQLRSVCVTIGPAHWRPGQIQLYVFRLPSRVNLVHAASTFLQVPQLFALFCVPQSVTTHANAISRSCQHHVTRANNAPDQPNIH